MPDLDIYQIKKSHYDVKYIYVQHSICSLHMIYRAQAFDNFDVVCCIGEHQVSEVLAQEKAYKLKKKEIIPMRYSRVDEIKLKTPVQRRLKLKLNKKMNFLIAPSWGEHGIIENGLAFNVIRNLLELNYSVILRPHPQTKKIASSRLKEITDFFLDNKNFSLISDLQEIDSFYLADYMISDWSGVALEFAFALKKPVIFCDTPRKINNANYAKLQIEPIEAALRNSLGIIWDCKTPIKETIKKLKSFPTYRFKELENKHLFDKNTGTHNLIQYIDSKLDSRGIPNNPSI